MSEPEMHNEAETMQPDQYRALVDVLDITERHKLLWAAPKAIRAAETIGGDCLDEMRTEANIAWLFAHNREWDEIIALGARLFGPQNLPYLERRARETANAVVSAWYCVAAWMVERRVQRASAAVDAFLYAAETAAKEGEEAKAFAVLRLALFSAYRLAAAAQRLDEVRERVFVLTVNMPKSFALIRVQFIEALVGDKTVPREMLAAVRPMASDLLETLSSYDSDELRWIAALGARVDARLGTPNERHWDQLLGDALRRFIPTRPEGMVRATVAQQAAAAYQRAGDENGAKEMRDLSAAEFNKQQWVTLSAESGSGEPSMEAQAEQWIADARSRFRRTLHEGGPQAAIALLAAGPYIVPDAGKIKADIRESRARGIGVFEELVKSYEVSADGRIVGHSGPGMAAERRTFIRTYELYAAFEADLAVLAFGDELVASGEVTLDELMTFVSRTWVGRREGDASGEEAILTLLRPGLRVWVEQYTRSRSADERILGTDSLTSKSETILRKLARLIGVPDVRSVQRAEGLVDEYRGLELLDDERIATVIGPHLVEFVRFTLDRDGEGLRDRIAHGAGTATDYSAQSLDRIVLVLLRICAVQIPENERPRHP